MSSCPSNPKYPCRPGLWTDVDQGFPDLVLLQCVWCGTQKRYVADTPRVQRHKAKKPERKLFLCYSCGQWDQEESHDCPRKEGVAVMQEGQGS